METIRKYVIFLNPGNDIVHNGIRLGTPEMLRADFPGAAIVPADEVPANWQEMSVQNGQLVAASAEVLAARRQAETARIQQQMGLTERIVPGEFWLDADGATKRQVYQRTFAGTVPDRFNPWTDDTKVTMRFYFKITSGINTTANVCKYVAGGIHNTPPDSISGNNEIYHISSSGGGIDLTFNQQVPPSFVGKRYCITIQYTKA